jgi:hypothetical protein
MKILPEGLMLHVLLFSERWVAVVTFDSTEAIAVSFDAIMCFYQCVLWYCVRRRRH